MMVGGKYNMINNKIPVTGKGTAPYVIFYHNLITIYSITAYPLVYNAARLAAYAVYYARIPMYAVVNIGVYTAQKKVNV